MAPGRNQWYVMASKVQCSDTFAFHRRIAHLTSMGGIFVPKCALVTIPTLDNYDGDMRGVVSIDRLRCYSIIPILLSSPSIHMCCRKLLVKFHGILSTPSPPSAASNSWSICQLFRIEH